MTDFDMASDFDFSAAMREAEATAEAVEATKEAADGTAEAAVAEPVPAPENTETETEATAEEAAEAETAEAQLLAGRFKTVDELERGYQEALNRLSQRDEKAAGYDDLKQQLDERLGQFEQRLQPPPQPVTHDLIEDNPAAAAQLAWQQGNHAALTAAMDYWKDTDPFAAALWVSQRQLEQHDRMWTERLEHVQQQFQPAQAAAEEQQWARSYQELALKYPDLEQLAPTMSEIAPEHPVVLQTLESGTPDSKAKALESLYLIARGRNAGNLQAAEQQAQAAVAEQAEAARKGAFVASTTQTSAPAASTTLEEQEATRFLDQVKANQARWDSGWDRPAK